jgi:hypothetical protein
MDLSRNLESANLGSHLSERLAVIGSRRVEANTVLCLDLSDVRKEYARKMESLALVRNGSTGELHEGYWLCEITAAGINGRETVPLYQTPYSAEAKDFRTENAELLSAVDLV